jgi:hypothetical protein
MDRQGRVIGCLAALLVVGAVSYLGWHLTLGRPATPDRVADRFLALVAEGKGEEAMLETAPALRARSTPDLLILQARKLGLKGYAGSSWTEVRVEGREATLEGTVTTRGGDDVPLVVQLVRGEQQWLVLSLAAAPKEEEQTPEAADP